jgi:CARDB
MTVRRVFAPIGATLAAVLLVGPAGLASTRPSTPPPPETALHRADRHGPFSISGAELWQIAKPRTPLVSDEARQQEPEDALAGRAPRCGRARCGERPSASRRLKPSPPLTSPSFTCCYGGVDPQIAAGSKSFLVVGVRDHVLFLDKAGQPLYPKPASPQPAGAQPPPAPYGPVYLCNLFAPMLADVNAHLGLPTSKRDREGHAITVQNGYGINCDAQTGGIEPTQPKPWKSNHDFYWPTDEIYDARVLWDEYHKRFWIGALLKNSNTVAYPNPKKKDPHRKRPATRSANVRSARRALLAIAVSKTQDPRDGWNLAWAWGDQGEQGCPTSKGCVGFGSDYLSMGISSRYLTLESAGGPITKPGRRTITIIPTDPLVRGSGALVYQPNWASLGTNLQQPAIQHQPDFDHGREVFFATPVYDLDNGSAGDSIELSTVSIGGGPYNPVPAFHKQLVHVRRFVAVSGPGAPQKAGPGVSGAPTIGGGANWVNKLVYRNSNLYLVFDECRVWSDGDCVYSGFRFVRLHVSGIVKLKTFSQLEVQVTADRTFGGPVTVDVRKLFWSVYPALEVNGAGDVAFSYNSSSPFLFPQARYSIWRHNENDVRSSRVLANGQSTIGSSDDDFKGSWHHYLGMSVDGFDGTSIWMINGFADASHGWNYAIGKVFGKRHPDLAVLQSFIEPTGTGDYRLSLIVQNLGDGAAPASSASLSLSRSGAGTIPLESIAVPKLEPGGRSAVLHATITTPAGASHTDVTAKLKLDARQQLQEYDESNNTTSVAFP